MTTLALDTSVAVPLLLGGHAHHASVVAWHAGREVSLTAHSLVETYSVITRLPGDARVSPADAAHLLRQRFDSVLALPPDLARRVPEVLAQVGVAGGATYDALVGLAARHHETRLATRDARAQAT